MSFFKPLQLKNVSHSLSAATPVSSLQPSQRRASPTPEPILSTLPRQIERTVHSGHAFGEFSILPPKRNNGTGLPDMLKEGIENLSGVSMDDVRVHYNSVKPEQVEALAYTQGTDIYVGANQEKHLAHEAWHVVQQKQGRVRPTLQMKNVEINDEQGLEREANVMGAQAVSAQAVQGRLGVVIYFDGVSMISSGRGLRSFSPIAQRVIQRFGTAVESGNEFALVQHIQAYRDAQHYHERGFARGDHNVAVAFNAGGIFATNHSQNGRHAEDNLDRQLALAGTQATVTRIHTEREPCGGGGGGCQQILTANYITPGILTQNNITYWGEYQDQEKRKVGTQTVKDITETAFEQSFVGSIGGSQSIRGRNRQANTRYN